MMSYVGPEPLYSLLLKYKANTEKLFSVNFSANLRYMPKLRELSTVRKAQIIALDEAGNSVRAISLNLHIPDSTVQDIIRIS